ncbi:hypothetical protein EBN88_05310 [Streptomyces triticirhizae]|uniref:Uncharacterized protein n=1 Tax=Streptomyces triticirhizae TaxID=2483353 RepID=A0A3M2M4I4_9ACTN|nr:hypothetical protein EBN88_05310 [Streptomyces triticirhizae]
MMEILLAAPAAPVAPPTIGGKILGTVGAGGIALALTAALVAGIRQPKAGGGGKGEGGGGARTALRHRLTSDQALWTAFCAGTLYAAAGAFWSAPEQVSMSLAQVITDGGFGSAGLGGVALLCGIWVALRKLAPWKAAFMGIFMATIWAAAGGIWGIPKYLIMAGAHAVGIV